MRVIASALHVSIYRLRSVHFRVRSSVSRLIFRLRLASLQLVSDVDYRQRAERLMRYLDLWVAHIRWEKKHGIAVVNWEIAFLSLLARPDAENGKPEPRDFLLSRTAELLQLASDALNIPRRSPQLAARVKIEAFLEEMAHVRVEESPERLARMTHA